MAHVLHKGISHTAADDDGIALVDQIRNHTDLVRHLSATQNGNQRALGICQCTAHKLDLLLDQVAAGSRQVRSHTGGGAMGTVCSAECVVHKQVCQRSQLLGEVLLVLGLLCTVTHILQQHHLAVLQVGSHLLSIVTDYILVLSQRHIHAQVLAQALGHGSQAELRLILALGSAQVGAQNHLGALLHQVLNGGQCSHNTLVIGDLAVFQRNIKVAAYQYALAFNIQIFNGFFVQCVHKITTPSS